MIRVLIVDDDDLMRAGLAMIVGQAPDLEVVGEASSGLDVPEAVAATKPDVILMDVRMPGLDGIEATKRLVESNTRGSSTGEVGTGDLLATDEEGVRAPKVLILTTFEMDEYVFAALDAGASGFLLKRTPPEQLIEGVRTVYAGDALLSPSVTRRLIDEVTKDRRTVVRDERIEELTLREREVLVAMANGWSNTDVSERLFISENTVKTHVKRVLMKLDARDRVQAVVMAYRSGLMDEG